MPDTVLKKEPKIMKGTFQDQQQMRGNLNPGLPETKMPAFFTDTWEASKNAGHVAGTRHVPLYGKCIPMQPTRMNKGKRSGKLHLRESELFKMELIHSRFGSVVGISAHRWKAPRFYTDQGHILVGVHAGGNQPMCLFHIDVLLCVSLPFCSILPKNQWRKYPQMRINNKIKIK